MDHSSAAEALKDGETYADPAVSIEQAAQRCHDCMLEIPDTIDIRQFSQSAEMLADTRATVLMDAGSTYDSEMVRNSTVTLYQHVVKMKSTLRQPREHRQTLSSNQPAIDDDYPVTKTYKYGDLPGALQKELKEAFMTYTQNRKWLHNAIKARGHFTRWGFRKGGGKGNAGKGSTIGPRQQQARAEESHLLPRLREAGPLARRSQMLKQGRS